MKGFKKLTETDYKLIKTLDEAGLGTKKIADVTGRSLGTIWRVVNSENLADYRLAVRTSANKSKATRKAVEIEKQPVVNDEAVKLLLSNAEALAKMQETLTFIADHIEVAPKRRFF